MARRGLSLRVRVIAVALGVVLAPLLVVGAAGLHERSLVSRMRENVETAARTEASLAPSDEAVDRSRLDALASDRAIWLRVVQPDGRVVASSDHDRGSDRLHRIGAMFFFPDGAPTLAEHDARLEPVELRPEVASATMDAPRSDCRSAREGTLLVCHGVMRRHDGTVVYAAESSRRAVVRSTICVISCSA